MNGAVLIGGFLMGIASSLHCIGMCGPLTLLIPVTGMDERRKKPALYIYHAGRLTMYMVLGMITGMAGRFLYLAGMQQSLSIAAGTILVIVALIQIYPRLFNQQVNSPPLFNRVRNVIFVLLKKRATLFNRFLLGAANGLLPCGMVYIALGTTLSFSHIISSVSYMAMFGGGTLPALLLFSLGPQVLNPHWRYRLRRALPFFVVLTGLLLIVRGLNLDYSYLSPGLPAGLRDIISCR
ncbi:sulfite exporter TauE/SafE family protein [Pollutibacter soli]|uniref:sulfite exporter TauE/SafE family protein n=1 Tax=Pollutibacter soli TaxID=3034157 RepID=UPI003013D50A